MVLFFLFPVLTFLIAIFCSSQIFYRNRVQEQLSVPAVVVTLILHVIILVITGPLFYTDWAMVGLMYLTYFSIPFVLILSVLFFSPMALRKRLGIYLGGLLTVIFLALFAQYIISKYQYTAYRNKIDLLDKPDNIKSAVISAPAFGFDANDRYTNSSRFEGYLPVPEEVETQFSHIELGSTYPTWSINADADTEKETLISVHVYEKPTTVFDHLIGNGDSGVPKDSLFIVFDPTQKVILESFKLPKYENQWSPYLVDVADLNGDQKDEIIYSLVDDWSNDNFYALYFEK